MVPVDLSICLPSRGDEESKCKSTCGISSAIKRHHSSNFLFFRNGTDACSTHNRVLPAFSAKVAVQMAGGKKKIIMEREKEEKIGMLVSKKWIRMLSRSSNTVPLPVIRDMHSRDIEGKIYIQATSSDLPELGLSHRVFT